MNRYKKIISKFNRKNILVVGDLILDQYIFGSVSRISPEAPVPVVLQDHSFYTPGGAANVANNLRALSARVTLAGRIGHDLEGRILKKELRKKGIDIKGVFADSKMPTVTKTRIIAQHQQVVRIDRERPGDVGNKRILQRIFNFIKNHMDEFDAVIISDYGKGMITRALIETICQVALQNNKIITVDPKVENFRYYKSVTAITPNKKEAENAIRNIKIQDDNGNRLGVFSDKLDTLNDIDSAGHALLKYLNLEALLITLGEQGMRLFEKGKRPVSIDTKAQEVFDVTGAGDAVIAVFTLSLTAGATTHQAANLSNFAAGIVVGKMGAVAVKKQELLEAIKRPLS